MDAADGAAPPREQGWWGPLAAMLVLVLGPAVPMLRIAIPIADPLLLLAPAVAACALAGWRGGGRAGLAVLWSAFAVWVVWRAGSAGSPFGEFVQGWTVLLALAFGVVLVARVGEGFLSKGLLALALVLLVAMTVLVVVPGGPAGAVRLVSGEIGQRTILATRMWQEMTATPEWQELVRRSPGWGEYAAGVDRQIAALPGPTARIFPALLAVQSLAVLALSWAVYHRVGRTRLGPPLQQLRDVRFDDSLVWGVVAGLMLVALPVPGALRMAGINLLVFFGALYAVRGLGVILWFLTPGRVMAVVFAVFAALFWPVVGMVAVGLGLGDTWFDWRRSSRQESQRSE